MAHPNWWGMPPAILKGWGGPGGAGLAYEFLERRQWRRSAQGPAPGSEGPGLQHHKYRGKEELDFGDPLQTLWKNCIFGLCGVEDFSRKSYGWW